MASELEAEDKAAEYQSHFEAFLPCLVTSDDDIRRAASKMAARYFSDEKMMEDWGKSDKLSSSAFKQSVWKLTQVIKVQTPDCY